MPKIAGFTMYECDRPGKVHKHGQKPVEWIKPEDVENALWYDGKYIDSNQVERDVTLCPDCAAKFQAMQQESRDNLTKFMNGAI